MVFMPENCCETARTIPTISGKAVVFVFIDYFFAVFHELSLSDNKGYELF